MSSIGLQIILRRNLITEDEEEASLGLAVITLEASSQVLVLVITREVTITVIFQVTVEITSEI